MRHLLRLVSWRSVSATPVRALLTVLGLACGVALWVAIALINDATLETVRRGFEAVAGPTALTVVGPEAGFDAQVADQVRAVAGVARAVPVVEARGFFRRPDGRPRSVVVLGVDLVEEAAVGRAPATEAEVDPLVFLNEPDAVLLAGEFAREEGLAVGQTLTLATTHGQQAFTVRGLLKPGGLANAFGGQVAVMDLDAARAIFGKEGRTDRVDVALTPGATVEDVLPRLGATLGPGVRVERPAARGEVVARMVSAFQGVLSVVSLVALLVGLFLVSGTMGTLVAERRHALGILRAVGATRKQLFFLVILEAGALGVVGAALGVLAGRGLAQVLVRYVATAVTGATMVPLVVRTVQLSWPVAAAGLGFGVLAAVLGAARPAWLALHVQPVEALRPPERDATPERSSRLGLVGVGLLALLAVTASSGVGGRAAWIELLEVVLALSGALLATGWLVEAPLLVLRRLLARRGGRVLIAVRLGVEELARQPRRTAAAVRSLMLGLLLVVMVATLAGSFQSAVITWFTNTLKWDLMVTGQGSIVSGELQPLHEDVGRELLAVPGVASRPDGRAQGLRFTRFMHAGRQIALKAYDQPQADDEWAVFDLRGVPQVASGRRLFASPDPAVLVSEVFAAREHVQTGDPLELETPSGRVRFTVVGQVTDYSAPEGVLYLDRAVYRRLWNDPLVSGFGLRLAPGADVRAVRAELEYRFGPSRGLVVATTAEVRQETERAFADAFSFTSALVAAALLVGLFGLFNATLVGVLGRTRELGTLRAVGQSRAQVMVQVLTEASLQGLVGALSAAVLGAFVSWAWLVGAVYQALGWQVGFIFPWSVVGPTLGLGLVVGALAGAIPAWRAGRLDIVAAVSGE